jgi:hypothetical protein
MIPLAISSKKNVVDFSCYSCVSWLIIGKPLVNGDTCSGSRRDFRSFSVAVETLCEFRYLHLLRNSWRVPLLDFRCLAFPFVPLPGIPH